MLSLAAAVVGFLATVPGTVAVSINMCTEDTCGDCPVSFIVSEPTDGRPCVVYSRDDIITGTGFPPPSGGVQSAWINATPDAGTGLIVRSPADVGKQYCGVAVGTVNSPDTCGMLVLQETLTIVTCHSNEECVDEGLPGGPYFPPSRFATREYKQLAAGQSLVTAVKRADGSLVKPLAASLDGKDFMDGFFALFNATEQLEEIRKAEKRDSASLSPALLERDSKVAPGGPGPMEGDNNAVNGPGPTGDQGGCTAFTADDRGGYIRSGLNTVATGNIVQATPSGGDSTGSYTTGTSWTTTFEAGLNIDIFSASVSFSVTEMESSSIGFNIQIPPNQSGYIGWTPYFYCASGTAVCPGNDNQRGEACSPYQDNGGKGAGEFTFVQNFT